jgi:hypothetical protein
LVLIDLLKKACRGSEIIDRHFPGPMLLH